jgi:hypothetical protein
MGRRMLIRPEAYKYFLASELTKSKVTANVACWEVFYANLCDESSAS